VSAFGGVVALNRPLDSATAQAIADHFYEVILAPAYAPDALEILKRKRNLRIVEMPDASPADPIEVRILDGAMLVQTSDRVQPDPSSWKTVTRRQPTPEEIASLTFAWR